MNSRRLVPSRSTVPASGSASRPASRARVDLPAPDRPTTATAAPGATVRSRSRSTASPPWRTVMPLSRSSPRPAGSCPGRQVSRPVARARPREQLGGAPGAAARAAQPADQPDARADADRKHRVLARGDQIAGGDPVPGELHAGHGDHDDLQRRGDGHGLGGGPRLHAPGGVAVFPQERKRAEDALSFAGLRAGRGDRAGTRERVEQPGGDGPLRPAVPGADGGGVADQRPQDEGERGEADGEGRHQPGVDQPERYDAAERRYHRGGGQQHAGGRRCPRRRRRRRRG